MNTTVIYLSSGLVLLLMIFIITYIVSQKSQETFIQTRPRTEPHGVPFQRQHVSFGHTLPLAYEERHPGPLESASPDQTMVPLHHKYEVSPDCCPSVYSTDQGCVCWNPVDHKVNTLGYNNPANPAHVEATEIPF